MWEFLAKKADRLDRLLREQVISPWLSRQAWERLLEEGRLKINGRVEKKAGVMVPEGAQVQIDLPALGLVPANEPAKLVWSYEQELGVFFKDPGVNTYPLVPWERDTLANHIACFVEEKNWMRAEDFALLGEPPVLEGGLLQRLDRDTSGLVTAAFTKEAKAKYRKVFSGEVEKEYLAIVTGKPNISGMQTLWFLPSSAQKVQAFLEEKSGAEAVELFLKIVSSTATHGLVRIKTSQGRRHVVRAGLAALSLPLVGDSLYEGDASIAFHQLHAESLKIPGFPRIDAPPPQSFLDCGRSLGLHYSG